MTEPMSFSAKSFSFVVPGIPVTQGSTKAFVVAGKARITHDKRGPLLNWRNSISWAAKEAMPWDWPADLPVTVYATFYLPRPKSAPKRITLPAKKPDLDKLARGLLDSLTGVVVNDDAQVVWLHCGKQFATNQFPTGVIVEIEAHTE